MNFVLRVFALIAVGQIVPFSVVISQTCCSGGVPLSGNIGFESSKQGTFQMELSYDLNYLARLKNGSDIYLDETRRRITQSLLLKTGYSISSWMAVDGLFSLVSQGRRVNYQESMSEASTLGIGDAVLISKFILSRMSSSGIEIQVGAGPKIPLGRSDMHDDRGIALNADMQPGSGSWDLITWGYFARQLKGRPSASISGRMVGRINGSNKKYLGIQKYQFGNSLQLYMGIGDQMILVNRILTPSISLHYRLSLADRIDGHILDNTGGSWISVVPAIGWSIGQKTILRLVPEIPVYSRVDGIQLTPTFGFQMGFYHSLGTENKQQSKEFRL